MEEAIKVCPMYAHGKTTIYIIKLALDQQNLYIRAEMDSNFINLILILKGHPTDSEITKPLLNPLMARAAIWRFDDITHAAKLR